MAYTGKCQRRPGGHKFMGQKCHTAVGIIRDMPALSLAGTSRIGPANSPIILCFAKTEKKVKKNKRTNTIKFAGAYV